MKKILLFTGIVAILCLASCSKSRISCEITNPKPNTTFELGDVIELSVITNTKSNVHEVRIYLDDKGYVSRKEFPYNFQIYTYNLAEGTHTIRAVAITDDGTKDEATVSFNLIKYECQDFVSFSDGKLPLGWTFEKKCQIYSPGFDDNFCLRSNTHFSTIKTINANIDCLEFYAKKDNTPDWYHIEISFYIDGLHVKTIDLTNSWEKYTFDIQRGEHTFRWWIGYGGSEYSAHFDAFKFYKK